MENNAEYHITFEITNALIAEQSATAKKISAAVEYIRSVTGYNTS